MRHGLLAIVCLTAWQTAMAADKAVKPSPFATVVLREFDKWDKDHQGRLTFPVVEQWTRNSSLHGEEAAAMAELHYVLRKESVAATKEHKSQPTEFTRAFFERYDRMNAEERREHDNFDVRFSSCKKRLADESRQLFPEGLPKRSAMHQGHLSDCHFVSPLGSLVSKRPGDVKRMIEGDQKRGYKVRFPRHSPITISPLTDTEVGLFSHAGGNGLWLAALEKACGELHRRGYHMKTRDDFDALTEGPEKTRLDMALLTGHRPEVIPIPMPSQGRRKVEEAEHKVREALLRMNHSNRLCAASSRNENKTKAPPGMAGSHSYAVLGFNGEKNTIRLWNPWGNNHTPKGREGLANGYKTEQGVFDMPLSDFAHEFASICCETDKPVEHAPK